MVALLRLLRLAARVRRRRLLLLVLFPHRRRYSSHSLPPVVLLELLLLLHPSAAAPPAAVPAAAPPASADDDDPAASAAVSGGCRGHFVFFISALRFPFFMFSLFLPRLSLSLPSSPGPLLLRTRLRRRLFPAKEARLLKGKKN